MIAIPKQIQKLIGIIILIILIFLFKEWLRTKIIVLLGGYVNKEIKVVTDTEYIKGDVDTLAVFNHYVETNGIILNPKPKIVYRYLPGIEDDGEGVPTEMKEFTVDVSDTLITGTATIINDFNGDLQELKLKYKPLFPKFITRVDTVKVTKTITETLDNSRAKIGIGMGYNNLNHASLLAGYTTKNGWQIMAEYGKKVQDVYVPETIDVSSIKGFINPNEDIISLKIIKNF